MTHYPRHSESTHHFLEVFAFFAAGFFSDSGALRLFEFWLAILADERVPFLGSFLFLGVFALPSPFLVAAFLPLFALGLSSSWVSAFFSASDFASGAPCLGLFSEPGSFS